VTLEDWTMFDFGIVAVLEASFDWVVILTDRTMVIPHDRGCIGAPLLGKCKHGFNRPHRISRAPASTSDS
jgi:hypothetical protein